MTQTLEASPTETHLACPLCGGESMRRLVTPGRWIGPEIFGELRGRIGLETCHACGLVFTNPRPSDAKLCEFYSCDTYGCHEPGGSASAGSKADFILETVRSYLPAGASGHLLDYGAGGGGFMRCAQSRGWKVSGFEPGRRGLEFCRQAGLNVTDALDELTPQAYDLITLHHVFEHLANPTEVLDGIRPLLAKDGRLFIEVPNARSLRARFAGPFASRRLGADERYRAFPIHLMYYTARTLARTLDKAGWSVQTMFTLGMGLDEYLIRRAAHSKSAHSKSNAPSKGSAPSEVIGPKYDAGEIRHAPRRRLRHKLRDAFLSAGWGENLAAVAFPRGS